MTPQTELASKLKDVLSKMTQEEFDKEWSKVTSLNLESPSFGEVYKNITPIELPSDEEIKQESIKKYQEQQQSYENSIEMFPIDFANYLEVGFIEGAKWMRNKIQGVNK